MKYIQYEDKKLVKNMINVNKIERYLEKINKKINNYKKDSSKKIITKKIKKNRPIIKKKIIKISNKNSDIKKIEQKNKITETDLKKIERVDSNFNKEKILDSSEKIKNSKISLKKVEKKVKIDPKLKKKLKMDYFITLRDKINKDIHYPKKAKKMGHEGVVKVKFRILKDGKIVNIKIFNSSKYPILNSAAIDTIKKLEKYKPIPNIFKISYWDCIIPIHFQIM